jgi:2'-5' RNA ligase
MDEKRIFVSIDLPPSIIDYLKTIQNHNVYWIKWMPAKNLHITLNFLGDLGKAEIEDAKQILADTVPYYQPFVLRLSGTRSERDMLWLVPEESDMLRDLQSELKNKLKNSRLGKRERRSYIPHVLLAKSKTGRNMIWQPKQFTPMEFAVDKINLYESRLTPGAATHILIQSFPLG